MYKSKLQIPFSANDSPLEKGDKRGLSFLVKNLQLQIPYERIESELRNQFFVIFILSVLCEYLCVLGG